MLFGKTGRMKSLMIFSWRKKLGKNPINCKPRQNCTSCTTWLDPRVSSFIGGERKTQGRSEFGAPHLNNNFTLWKCTDCILSVLFMEWLSGGAKAILKVPLLFVSQGPFVVQDVLAKISFSHHPSLYFMCYSGHCLTTQSRRKPIV